jgi:tetratricopeptide (TPR) repeat protein
MSFLHEPGDLARTPLAAVLLEALNLRASGVLEVEHGGGTSRLWFRDGRPVGAQVFAGFRPLGHMLLQAGLIDIDALSRSLTAMAESGRPQGEILVEMGVISRADVDAKLAEQQGGYFGLIAALEQGGFRFDVAAQVPAWTRGSRLSPLRTIVDALERPQAGALVVSALQPVAAGGVRLASGYADVEGAFRWTDAERGLVARLFAGATLDAFFAPSQVQPERARAILAALLLLGLALPASDRGAPTGETLAGLEVEALELDRIDLAPALTPSPQPAVAPMPASPPSARRPALRRDERDQGSLRAAAPAPSPGPAPAPTPPAASSVARRSDPAEARARRQRLLQQAMRNMGVGPFGAPRADPSPPPTPSRPAPSPEALSSPTSAEEALRGALLAIAPRAREKDYFARLGIPDTAGKDEVKRAFLAIARQFHPDRFASPALRDLAEVVKDFFTAVNEAYDTLADDRRRAEYLATRKVGAGATREQVEAARLDFEKAEACLRTRDFARARGFYESAVRADPRPEHQAALAFALLADPQRKDRDRARALLEEATKDPRCDRAAYVAGILARDEGDDGRAERMFRAALQANPRHADAVRELRAVEVRKRAR